MNNEEIIAWQRETKAKELIKKMENRGFAAHYAVNSEMAGKIVLDLLPIVGSIALLGSQTMNQIGVYEQLRQSGRTLVDQATQIKPDFSTEEALNYKRGIFHASAMLASANAVDAEGRLYNIDGIGNRVAGMIFGPDSVILAIGLNKLTATPQEAWRRTRQIASPMNNKRLGLPNLCTRSGRCHDCQTPSSICNYFTIIDRSKPEKRIKVVLIGEDLGY